MTRCSSYLFKAQTRASDWPSLDDCSLLGGAEDVTCTWFCRKSGRDIACSLNTANNSVSDPLQVSASDASTASTTSTPASSTPVPHFSAFLETPHAPIK